VLRGCKQRLAERDTRHAAAAAAAAAAAPAVAAGLGVNGATRVAPVFSREGKSGQKANVLFLFICHRERDLHHAGCCLCVHFSGEGV